MGREFERFFAFPIRERSYATLADVIVTDSSVTRCAMNRISFLKRYGIRWKSVDSYLSCVPGCPWRRLAWCRSSNAPESSYCPAVSFHWLSFDRSCDRKKEYFTGVALRRLKNCTNGWSAFLFDQRLKLKFLGIHGLDLYIQLLLNFWVRGNLNSNFKYGLSSCTLNLFFNIQEEICDEEIWVTSKFCVEANHYNVISYFTVSTDRCVILWNRYQMLYSILRPTTMDRSDSLFC